MEGFEFVALGFVFTVVTGMLEFGFGFEANAFFMSIGIMIGWLIIMLFEKYKKKEGWEWING